MARRESVTNPSGSAPAARGWPIFLSSFLTAQAGRHMGDHWDDLAVRLVGKLVPPTLVHGRLGQDLVVRSCRVSEAELSALRVRSSNRWALRSDADGPRRSDGGVPLRPWSLDRSHCDPASHGTTRRILGDFSYGSTTGALEPGSALRRRTGEVPRRDRGRGLEVRNGRGNEGPGGDLLIYGCMKAPKRVGGSGPCRNPLECPTLRYGLILGPPGFERLWERGEKEEDQNGPPHDGMDDTLLVAYVIRPLRRRTLTTSHGGTANPAGSTPPIRAA